MSNMKHTAGPWTIDEKLEGQTCITSKQHGSFAEPIICRVFDSSHVPIHEQDANARLIAAAPDNLDANIAALETRRRNADGTWCISDRAMNMIERAIGKAING